MRYIEDANADLLAAAGCAFVVADAHLSDGGLRAALEAALHTEAALESMRRSYIQFTKDKPISFVDEAVRISSHG